MAAHQDAATGLARTDGGRQAAPIAHYAFKARRANPVFSDEYRILRDVVRAARIASRLSQRDLAAGLGKHPSHVAMIECGQRRIDALELYRMAKVLGVPPARLFETIAARLDELEEAAP